MDFQPRINPDKHRSGPKTKVKAKAKPKKPILFLLFVFIRVNLRPKLLYLLQRRSPFWMIRKCELAKKSPAIRQAL